MINTEYIISIVLSALAVLITLPLHELSHGYIAYKLGDHTAKDMGRLTLNPLKHLDPIGALCLIFLKFGWAKPVPVNPRNLRNPKRDFALVALAGPISNIILAFLSALLWLLTANLYISTYAVGTFLTRFLQTLLTFIGIFHSVNLGLAIFNLLPVPPLDGSRILCAFLPDKAVVWILQHERKIYLGLLIWLIGGSLISDGLLSIPIVAANPYLSAIANYLSLSNILGSLSSLLSDLMFSFWELIPALKL